MLTLDGVEILKLLREKEGINPVSTIVLDQSYLLPASDWMSSGAYANYKAFLTQNRATMFLKESFDCDDYALAMVLFGRFCNRLARQEASLALGMLTYLKNSGGGVWHAINFMICSDDHGQTYEVVFIEPQTGERIRMDGSETESVVSVLF